MIDIWTKHCANFTYYLQDVTRHKFFRKLIRGQCIRCWFSLPQFSLAISRPNLSIMPSRRVVSRSVFFSAHDALEIHKITEVGPSSVCSVAVLWSGFRWSTSIKQVHLIVMQAITAVVRRCRLFGTKKPRRRRRRRAEEPNDRKRRGGVLFDILQGVAF